MLNLRAIVITIAALLASTSAAATAASTAQQRQRFLEARSALEQGDSARFAKLTAQLSDYPLYPYLVYWQMERMDNLDRQRTYTFLSTYGDAPFVTPLREQWLGQLASQERWDQYLTDYRPSRRSELRCHYHYAQLQGGNEAAAWAGARDLWLSPERQDNACNRLFEAWQKSGELTSALRRQRLDLALQAGNMEFATQLATSFSEEERARVALWRQIHKRPSTLIETRSLQKDNDDNRELIVYGLKRLTRSDARKAAQLWREFESRYRFTEMQRTELLNTLVVRLALDGDASALDWFAQIPAEAQQSESRQWAVRVALRHQRWNDALALLRSLPANERRDEEWQYWMARSLESIGETELAKSLYHGIAYNSSYYGFLASDRLELGYNLSHQPVNVDEAALAELGQIPAMSRAYELLQVNLNKEARREWDYAILRMSPEQRITAGKLASHWSWHDRAALTLAKADYYDDLEIRFPLAYTDAVIKEAQANTLDPAWVFAVARQESVMNPEARSPVGALGLMQLMPATGRNIARKLKSAISDLQQLLVPETNIRFGSYYLRELSDQFGDHKALATAAYNAGPHRVVKWTPPQTNMDADIWVDNIPFGETRQYVRRVLAYSVFYDQRLEKDIVRLRERMPKVKQ
jgi:soluble lytic murein transglycosylase